MVSRGPLRELRGQCPPFPCAPNEIRRCKFEFHDRFKTVAWNIISSSTMADEQNRVNGSHVDRLFNGSQKLGWMNNNLVGNGVEVTIFTPRSNVKELNK